MIFQLVVNNPSPFILVASLVLRPFLDQINSPMFDQIDLAHFINNFSF